MFIINKGKMKLLLRRIAKRDTYTIGKLYIDGKYFCDTLEDKDRNLTSEMDEEYIKQQKVYGRTAIPSGVYQVQVTYSPRFKKNMPLVKDVKGFSGIRIHSGNTDKDTEGCILVGKNTKVGMVTDSRKTYYALFSRLSKCNPQNITLHIV